MTTTVPLTSQRESKRLVLHGLYPATVTPFEPDYSVDLASLEHHLRETAKPDGVNGLVVNGGLGELLQLSIEEQVQIIEMAVRVRRPGQLIIAGIEGRSAKEAVHAGLAAKMAGADALLVLPPFDVRAYRRLAADVQSVYGFFAELDARIDLPMIVFQYPPQSGCAYSTAALLAIAELGNVVGIKAASGVTPAYIELWDALHDKVSVLAAVDSPPLYEMLMHGSHGALIGISTIAPEHWVALLRATEIRDERAAEAIFEKVCKPLMAAVFENQQPKRRSSEVVATKEALVQLGQLASSRVRLPAVDIDGAARVEIRESLIAVGLLRR